MTLFYQMDTIVTTPVTSDEADKTMVQLEENHQTRINRMKRDLKVTVSLVLYFIV